MTNVLRSYSEAVWEDCERSFNYVKGSGPLIAIIAPFVMPIGYWVDIEVGNPSYDTAVIRTIATLACIGLAFTKLPGLENNKYYVVYWFFTQATMVGAWGAMLALNAATVPHGENSDLLFWLLQYIVSLFMFSQLCTTPQLGISAWSLSVVVVYMLVGTLDNPNWESVHSVLTVMLPIYVIGIWLGAYYNHNRTIARQESLSALRAVATNVAHEIRTPITGIATRSAGISGIIASLTQGRDSEVDGNPDQFGDMLDRSKAALESIEREASRATSLINTILIQTEGTPATLEESEVVGVTDLLNNVIETFPYDDGRMVGNISVEVTDDFVLEVPKTRVTHMLYSLINAAKDLLDRPDLNMCLECSDKENRKVIRLIPKTMEDGEQALFLRPVQTTSELVLEFCESTMNDIGGSLSIDNGRKEIVLSF